MLSNTLKSHVWKFPDLSVSVKSWKSKEHFEHPRNLCKERIQKVSQKKKKKKFSNGWSSWPQFRMCKESMANREMTHHSEHLLTSHSKELANLEATSVAIETNTSLTIYLYHWGRKITGLVNKINDLSQHECVWPALQRVLRVDGCVSLTTESSL